MIIFSCRIVCKQVFCLWLTFYNLIIEFRNDTSTLIWTKEFVSSPRTFFKRWFTIFPCIDFFFVGTPLGGLPPPAFPGASPLDPWPQSCPTGLKFGAIQVGGVAGEAPLGKQEGVGVRDHFPLPARSPSLHPPFPSPLPRPSHARHFKTVTHGGPLAYKVYSARWLPP